MAVFTASPQNMVGMRMHLSKLCLDVNNCLVPVFHDAMLLWLVGCGHAPHDVVLVVLVAKLDRVELPDVITLKHDDLHIALILRERIDLTEELECLILCPQHFHTHEPAIIINNE